MGMNIRGSRGFYRTLCEGDEKVSASDNSATGPAIIPTLMTDPAGAPTSVKDPQYYSFYLVPE